MLSTEDKKAAETVISRFAEAWNRDDTDSFAALLAEDCEWVNVVGMNWHGKAQVLKAHRVFLATMFKDVRMHEVSRQVSEIAPGVAIVISTSKIDDYSTPDGKLVTDAKNRMTWILVKEQDRWLIRSAHNTTIDPPRST